MENDIVFHLEANGNVVIDTNSSIPNNTGDAAAISDSGIVMTIRNPIIKGTVTLTKYWKERSTDAFNEQHLLPGAVYKLTMVKNAEGQEVNTPVKTGERTSDGYAYNETGTVDRFTTDGSGKIVVTGLPEGTYEFLEVDAPPAYHINNEEADKIQFTIVNAEKAWAVIDRVMDARVNASIFLTKYSGENLLPGAVFDVAYSETENGTYTSIGTMTTGDDGVASFPQGTYPGSTTPEGLRRGHYRLTELSADGQMLNDTKSTRNTITFEIGNELNKEYKVRAGLDYSKGGSFISLEDRGVVDTPIPTKSITVHKVWKDDSGLELTFQPASIQVQLYRSYNGGEPEAVGNSVTLNAGNDWRYTWEDQRAYVNEVTGENGKMTTYLYTYTVREVDGKSWYDVQYNNSTVEGPLNVGEEDGNTTSTITNTLIGGGEKKNLTIRKTLGGGVTEDAFQVRVILKRDGEFVGNSESGYYLDRCKVVDGSGNELRTETPDAKNGWMTIHGGESITVELPKGVSYEVEEKDYTPGKNSLDYTPRYDGNQTGTIENQDITTTIRNAVHKSLSLEKQDSSGKKLQGAEFTVTYAPLDGSSYTGQPYTKTFTTDENGAILDENDKPIDLTNQGTYTIVETRAPAGYITPTDKDGTPIVLATVTVNENDMMSIVSASVLVAVDVISDGSKASVTVTNEQTKVFIGKTIDYADGTPLEGARLELYGPGNLKIFGEWTTGTDPELVTERLLHEDVVYLLHEVDASAPVGYLEAADVYFKLDGTYTDSNGNRSSRIVLTDKDGAPVEQNTNGNRYGTPGVVGGVLKLVDETIIAPVNLRKVLKTGENTWTALENVEFTVSDGTITFGTAVTNSQGYLIWKTLNSVADSSGETLVYNAQGSKEIGTGDVQSQNLPVILRQNAAGYQFRESYAPDHAYNDGRIYHVQITDGNFEEYRLAPANGAPQFDSTKYINIVEADANAETHTVENLSTRSDTTEFTSAVGLAVNLPYKSTIILFKYDADEGANNGPLPGTEFTLYHAVIGESGWTPGAVVTDAWETGKTDPQPDGVFTTDSDGKLSIEIHKKGSYILMETAAAPGYKLSANPPTLEFTLIDGNDGEERQPYWYNGTNEWKLDDTGIPNESIHLSLTKVDYDDSNTPLSGVTFTLEPAEDSSFIASYAENNPGRIVDGKITLTTDDQGAIKIPKGLVQQDNSYILTETDLGSNISYRLAEKAEDRQITFLVNADGTMTITKENDMFSLMPSGEATVDATKLLVKNQQISLTVFKRDQVSGNGVEKVTLRLSKQIDGTWTPFQFEGVTDADGKWTTGADGKVTFQGTGFTPGTYRLEETGTPQGYNSIAGALIFTIDQSGKISSGTVNTSPEASLTDGPGESEKQALNFTVQNPEDGQAGGIQLNVDNAAYSTLQLTKKGSDGQTLDGVTIRLDYWDDRNSEWYYINQTGGVAAVTEDGALTPGTAEKATLTTGGGGKITVSNLPNGKYRLTELKTVQGYNLLSAPLVIEIDRNRETYQVSMNGVVISEEGDVTRNGNTILLTIINQKGLALPATGTATPQLPKAVLWITALLEGLVLYLYQTHGKRRKKGGVPM